jgi:antitoxin CptB
VTDTAPARLRWRCRRGMKELDVLLDRWLLDGWPRADATRRRAFEWLLEQPDPELADWLLGGARPAHAVHSALLDEIVRRRA